ncbi:MAG: phosphate ABC transporter permease subunit PstC [Thermoleophilia bacterium]|nr:phosphate ABC transporter permease subunit PstC [Thermoleophilia bacterium]
MTPPPPPAPPDEALARHLPSPLRRTGSSIAADRTYTGLAVGAAIVAVVFVGYLIWNTVAQTGEVWSTFGVWGFLTGDQWLPTPVSGAPIFGALPFIYGTLMTSILALMIAVPAAIGIALATVVLLPKKLRGPIGAMINLLAAVPSVIFGLWGLTVLVPFLKPALEWLSTTFGGLNIFGWHPFEGPITSGSYLISALVLAVMVLPIITAIIREVLLTVPRDQQEAAYALGATRWEMVRNSMLPWARSGIVGASALGLGRAVGETIAIALLLGNSPGIFTSLVGPGSTLASIIALQTGEASGLQLSALTALAVVLFLLAFGINALARLLVRRHEGGAARKDGLVSRIVTGIVGLFPRRAPKNVQVSPSLAAGAPPPPPPRREPATISGSASLSRSRRVRSRLGEGVVWFSLAFGMVPLILVIWEMVRLGLPAISGSFFTELPPTDPSSYAGGISNALVGTLILMGIATLIAAPLGILTALFIRDVARPGTISGKIGSAVGFVVDILLGVPSIVVGLIVYLGVVIVMGHFSALAGGIALAIIMFPVVVRASDEVLQLVPQAQKEAAMALGAPKWRTTLAIVIPAALPGIITGVLLGVARASGETAPLLFTSLGNQFFSTALNEPISAIPQLIYQRTIQVATPASLQLAWGAALVLVAIIFILNIGGALISRRSRTLEAR